MDTTPPRILRGVPATPAAELEEIRPPSRIDFEVTADENRNPKVTLKVEVSPDATADEIDQLTARTVQLLDFAVSMVAAGYKDLRGSLNGTPTQNGIRRTGRPFMSATDQEDTSYENDRDLGE